MKKEKTKVEKFFDKYAKDYVSDDLPPGIINARAAMSFANDITWHFMLKYIPQNKEVKILDAGAGDGYWTQKLIELGYKNVTLLDLSQKMLNEARRRLSNLSHGIKIRVIKGDIVDMNMFDSNIFDYVFSQFDAVSYCLNPKKATKELSRVVKKNRYIIVSLDTKFRRVPEFIEANQLVKAKKLLKTNISDEMGYPQYNLTWEELAEYYEEAGIEVIEVIGAPVFMHQINEEILEKLEKDPEIRNKLLEMELEYCTNKSLVNFAGHLQMVGKKI